VAIRTSSAKQVDALVADLASNSQTIRDAAVARLTVIGSRAVDRLKAVVEQASADATARIAALRALEAIGDGRALDIALLATHDRDSSVACAAIDIAGAFLVGPRGPAALDRLMAIAVDRAERERLRLAALDALEDLASADTEPLRKLLHDDPNERIRARATERSPAGARPLGELMEGPLPDDPEQIRQMLSVEGLSVALAVLHRIIERLREHEANATASSRAGWERARAAAHVALANRGSRLGLYDLRESLEQASTPLPVEFLAALGSIGDASCLESIVHAYRRSRDDWWRRHLADTFGVIVRRERITRRHAVIKKLEARWPAGLEAIWPPRSEKRAQRAPGFSRVSNRPQPR